MHNMGSLLTLNMIKAIYLFKYDEEEMNNHTDLPDVSEGYAGELAAPAEGHDTSTEDGESAIAAVLGARETAVWAAPHAVDRVSSSRLSNYILEFHLVWKFQVPNNVKII